MENFIWSCRSYSDYRCNDILLTTKEHQYDLQAASAHTNTVRLPEALGIPAATFTVQGDTARFAVRVRRYNTWLHLLRHLPLAPPPHLASHWPVSWPPHFCLKLLLLAAAVRKVCSPHGRSKYIAQFIRLSHAFVPILFISYTSVPTIIGEDHKSVTLFVTNKVIEFVSFSSWWR